MPPHPNIMSAPAAIGAPHQGNFELLQSPQDSPPPILSPISDHPAIYAGTFGPEAMEPGMSAHVSGVDQNLRVRWRWEYQRRRSPRRH
jgi:hypothetical protein